MPLGTPYVTPAMLINAPTGVSWNIIPEPDSSFDAQTAEATNICWRATSMVDTTCNQVLRATVDVEALSGPGAPRTGVERATGVGLLRMRRWPVTEVLAVQISLARAFPRQWVPVPAAAFEVERPLLNALTDSAPATGPDGGNGVRLAPGYLVWRHGRGGQLVWVAYVNGWPHTSLTADAAGDGTVLHVDDVTGWTGAAGFVYDGAATETVSVLAVAADVPLILPDGAGVAQSGPGTVTLARPLAEAHTVGVVVSALPASVLQATILAAAMQPLESGVTAITVQEMPGSTSTGGKGVVDLVTEHNRLLAPFKRVV